jgi:hypothetical protein
VTAGEVLPDVAVCRELASVLRAGDDETAAGLAARAGIPRWLLAHPELGPRGLLDASDAAEALGCISVLAAGHGVGLAPWLAKPAVIDLVAEAVETAATRGATAGHPWARGIEAVEECGRPAIAVLLRARAEEPVRDADGYYAYLKSLPARFWTRNTPDEIEYTGEVQPGRLTNLGTIRRGVKSFTVTANSVRRAADLEAIVLAAASAAGCPADVTKRESLTADELTGTPPEADDGPASREAACRATRTTARSVKNLIIPNGQGTARW